jgi:IS5 family transposase
MKGQQSLADIEYAKRKRRTKRDEFLEAMNEIIAWEEWCGLVEPHYPKGERGRPPRGVEIMLRMYLLQNWFDLSDEGLEDAIYDSYAFRTFMGIDFMGGEQVPDATTLCKFRKLLDENGITEKFFEAQKDFLDKHGRIMHGGSIVDATIVAAPTSTKNEKHERDPEMHSVKKGNQWYFGERMHIGVDAGSGYIHDVEVTAAHVAEREIVPKLLRADDEVCYGDAGYTGMEKRKEIQNDEHLSQMIWRINERKPYRKNNAWTPGEGTRWQQYFNWKKSCVRSKVEYSFFIIKRIFHYNKVRYRGMHKNRTQAYTLCALANLYMLRQSGWAIGAA